MIQDITERKQPEDRISADQAELRRLLDEADRSRLALLSVLEDRMKASSTTSKSDGSSILGKSGVPDQIVSSESGHAPLR